MPEACWNEDEDEEEDDDARIPWLPRADSRNQASVGRSSVIRAAFTEPQFPVKRPREADRPPIRLSSPARCRFLPPCLPAASCHCRVIQTGFGGISRTAATTTTTTTTTPRVSLRSLRFGCSSRLVSSRVLEADSWDVTEARFVRDAAGTSAGSAIGFRLSFSFEAQGFSKWKLKMKLVSYRKLTIIIQRRRAWLYRWQ